MLRNLLYHVSRWAALNAPHIALKNFATWTLAEFDQAVVERWNETLRAEIESKLTQKIETQ